MNVYYQGIDGAYSHLATNQRIQKHPGPSMQAIGKSSFADVRDCIQQDAFAVLPIENSYAGSIHENIYQFLRREDMKVVEELYLPVNHCLLSQGGDLSKITKAYSHPQALAQCHDFLQDHNIEAIPYLDTAKSAQFVAQEGSEEISAIASSFAGELYNLHTLAQDIQDQDHNTTRFFIVASQNNPLFSQFVPSSPQKTSLVFQAHHIPASLYKCLGAFATNTINLTKIESLPSYQDPFVYNFWIDVDRSVGDEAMQRALDELSYFTTFVNIIGEY